MRAAWALLRMINIRHARRHRLRTILTALGVASGVALVFSISVINATLLSSFRSSMRELGGAAELEVAASDQSGLPQRTLARVADTPGVEEAVPVLRSITSLRSSSGSHRTLVLGITPTFVSLFPQDLNDLARVEVSGGFGRGDGILLAGRVADQLDVAVGDTIEASTPQGRARVTVTGRISGGALAAVNGGELAVMLLHPAQELFDKRDRIDSIYVITEPDADLGQLDADLTRLLGGAAVVGPPGERGTGLERIFEGIGTLLAMAGAVALFVSLFVVYNTMSMSLSERRREISMALAFGAQSRQLFAAFMSEAFVLGTLSSLLGLAGGSFLANMLIEQAAQGYDILPVTVGGTAVVTGGHIALALIGGIAVSLLGAFLPARRVARVAAIESLRPDASYEWAGAGAFGLRRRTSVAIAGSLLLVAAAMFVASSMYPENRWVVIVGIVSGLAAVTFLLPVVVPLAVAVVRPVMRACFGTVGRLSGDSLTQNPTRTTFTVAALVLTLGMVVGVGSALASYQGEVQSKALALMGSPIYVTSDSYSGLGSDQPLPASLRDDLERVDGVRFVYPLRFSLLNERNRQLLLYAVPLSEALEQGISSDLTSITEDPDGFVETLDGGGIAVSRTTAERYGLVPGDTFALPTPSGERAFRVGAIFEDLLEFDSAYMDYSTYQRYWNDSKADEFGILGEPGISEAQLEENLQRAVTELGAPAEVYTDEELLGRLLQIIEGTFSLGRGIQLAALVVAALTIANTLFTAVLERRWEMGLQRALGMGRVQLSRVVLLEAAGIGLIGGAGGAILGLASGFLMTQAMEVQYSWEIGFRPPVGLIALSLGLGTVVAAVAGLGPSRLAVRAPIIESLRYE